MQLQQMRYVLAAAEKKSFSAAAKSLFISQPSLSQQIGNLEKELGIPLFIRHSKSVTLTDAGKQFVIQAQRILNQVENTVCSKAALCASACYGLPDILAYPV